MKKTITTNIDSVITVVKAVTDFIGNQDMIILLQGDLAAGKTTLVKEFVKFRDIEDSVTSPTFSVQSCYGDDIYHYDLYNKSLNQFISLGLLEEFEKNGIHFVEWGEDDLKRILDDYGFNTMVIKIKKLSKEREYTIET